MKTLIISATKLEVAPLVQAFSLNEELQLQQVNEHTDLLITKVSMLQTYRSLIQNIKQKNYNQFIQIGIAGSYDFNLELGSLVEVTQEQIGDVGAENLNKFILFEQKVLKNKQYYNFPTVNSISVNTCSGSENTINNRLAEFNPTIENMEGYAFFQYCKDMNIKHFAQVRSISNYVEPRNKDKWQTELAINNLNSWLMEEII